MRIVIVEASEAAGPVEVWVAPVVDAPRVARHCRRRCYPVASQAAGDELVRRMLAIGPRVSGPSRSRAFLRIGLNEADRMVRAVIRLATPCKNGRHALQLLAKSSDGCTEAGLLAYGFNPDILAGLLRTGLVRLQMDPVRAGAGWFEIRRLLISDAGWRAIGRR